jgi:hypothetical protein
MRSVWARPPAPGQFRWVWEGFGMKEGSKQPKLHTKCKWTLWIHTRLILLCFSSYSPLDPYKTPQTVWKLPCFMCWLGQLRAVLGGFGMKEGSKQPNLHTKWTLWIHTRLILMCFSSYSPLDPWKTPQTVWKLPCFLWARLVFLMSTPSEIRIWCTYQFLSSKWKVQ